MTITDEDSKKIKEEVYALSKDVSKLEQSKANLTNKFNFVMEDYAFMAIVLLKYDKNLAEVR